MGGIRHPAQGVDNSNLGGGVAPTPQIRRMVAIRPPEEGLDKHMKPRRLFGSILALVSIVLIIYLVRLDKKAVRDSQVTADQAVSELRQILRSEADSAFARFEPLRVRPPMGSDPFLDYLKDAVNRGEILGGFVELPVVALMDPSDTAVTAAEMMPAMAISTPPGLKIPPGEMTEDFLKTMESAAEQMKPVDPVFPLHLDGPPPSDWGIRAYLSPYNDLVHLIGLAFAQRSSLQPELAQALNDRFYGSSGGSLTIQLVNAAGQTAYIAGEFSGKKLIRQEVLVPAELGYSGWKVNVYAPSLNKLYLVFSAIAGNIGIVLAVF